MKGGAKAGGLAYVVAVSMGYGHERAADALRSLALGKKVILANDYAGMAESDRRLWNTGRTWYERISRFKNVPILGTTAFRIMDEIQEIPSFYPRRDLSAPTLQIRQTYAMIHGKKFCKDLIDTLAKNPKPLVCTFMTPAFAAEEFGYPGDIYLVICDADCARAWAPLHPQKTRIKYIAPTGRVAERLQLYGIPKENIFLTGFPLPMDAIGGLKSETLLKDLSRRMCSLDPQGVLAEHSSSLLNLTLGEGFCEATYGKKRKPIALTFAVGGAGAQREMAIAAAQSLAPSIREGKLTMNLVAGTRPEIAEYFHEALESHGLGPLVKSGKIEVLFSQDRTKYFKDFGKLMRETDVLWTKPSELSFYAGLGIPILMAPTVGSQEDFNRLWLHQVGAGIEALQPEFANEWLWDWVHGGALARMAWNGYINAPTHGAYRIADVVRGRPWSMHRLPFVV